MKTLFLAAPLLMLSACEGSPADIAGDIASEANDAFKDGQSITETAVDPGEFTEVSLLGPDNIVFTSGSDYSIRAEGDAKAVEELRFTAEDGNIKIGRKGNMNLWGGNSGAATIYLTAPSLSAASVAGSGNVKIDKMSGEKAELSLAGSGSAEITEISGDRADISIAGSGNVTLSGAVKTLDISIAGSGEVKGKGLKADKADISIAGSGDVEISSDGTVEASLMGSGDVRVNGTAKCESSIMGSGELKCGE